MTEGEEFITNFLEKNSISFRKQEPIDGLQNDSKNIRVADFYLTKYKVYIEYFGQWNMDTHKDRYREKRKVYIENKIPCVILYPENLGILEYIFRKRMLYVLKRYKLEKELNKYRFKLLWDFEKASNHGMYFFFGIIISLASYPFITSKDVLGISTGLALIAWGIYSILKKRREIYNE
jgi:hypothetical protein